MRWRTNRPNKEYEVRRFRKFALFPIRIGDEVRWLEFVTVEAYYWIGKYTGKKYWEYKRFIDKHEES